MSYRTRVQTVQRQWVLQGIGSLTLVAGTPQVTTLVTDVESPSLTSSTKLERIIGSVTAGGAGLTVGRMAFLSVGLLWRNTSDTNVMGALSDADADRPWLWRKIWPLPAIASIELCRDCNESPCFDWPMRQRGRVKKDNELIFCVEMLGVSAGTFTFGAELLCLYSG